VKTLSILNISEIAKKAFPVDLIKLSP